MINNFLNIIIKFAIIINVVYIINILGIFNPLDYLDLQIRVHHVKLNWVFATNSDFLISYELWCRPYKFKTVWSNKLSLKYKV